MIQPMCQQSMADMKKKTERTNSLSQTNVRKKSSCQSVSTRNEENYKRNRLFRTSLRQLQAKIEVENQQVQEIIKPLLDAENGFLKELECFLSQREVAELRRKELLHKRWTERVWSPLQRRVEEHVSSCRRRQSMCLRHCNSKGFVSLETYEPQEYNPFLLSTKNLQRFKLNTADLNDTFHLQLKEKKIKRDIPAHVKQTQYNPHVSNREQLMGSGIDPAAGSSHLNIFNH